MKPQIQYSTRMLVLTLAFSLFLAEARPWNLNAVHAEQAHRLGYTGAGVLVGVIDAGIDTRHPAFRGRIDARSRNFDSVDMRSFEETGQEGEAPGHGTHVAGVIGAARNVGPMHGIAFDAHLLILRAPGGMQPSTAPALRYAAKTGVKLLNGSYVIGPNDGPPRFMWGADGHTLVINRHFTLIDHQLITIDGAQGKPQYLEDFESIEATAAADIVLVFGAGNSWGPHPSAQHPTLNGMLPFIRPENHHKGVYRFDDSAHPDLDWINPSTYSYLEADNPMVRDLNYTHLQGALVVVVATNNGNKIASYSNRCGDAWQWCLSAPGGDEDAEGNGTADSAIVSTIPTNSYDIQTGTSQAAPLVSGAAAVLRGAYPYLTARQTIEILLTTADTAGHLADRAIYGRGMLDLGRAIEGPREFGAIGFGPLFDVDTQGHDSTWSGNIVDSGSLVKRGAGNLTLTGTHTYRGATRVMGGSLIVEGQTPVSPFYIEPGGTLAGHGTVGTTLMGGTIEPGRRLRIDANVAPAPLTGTMTVAGDYTHLTGGTWVASIAPDGTSNRLTVQGAADLQGGILLVQGLSPATLG
jgi:subtilase-type serine protease